MSSRYDPPESAQRSPLEPVPEGGRLKRWGIVTLLALTAGVGIAAAFGLDLCPFVSAVGVELDSCKAPAPEPSK